MTRILSTRKLQPNHRQFLLGAGLSVVEADFIETCPVAFELASVHDNLIFTSSNAVKAVSEHPNVQDIRRNPVFCVGEKTAELLDELGFTVLASAAYADELAEIITTQYASESFTFFSGNLRMDTLPTRLTENNIRFNEIAVYETALTPVKIDHQPDGILFFSPSAVESFRQENTVGDAMCFCIGTTTAKALQAHTPNIVIANKPTIENTIIQCLNHYKTIGA